MPYWCGGSRTYFSVRTGTPLQHSQAPLRKWVFATYLYVTYLKGVSSLKLHRDLEDTQETAWFVFPRLRESWGEARIDSMSGPVEADETYVGGKFKTMRADQMRQKRARPRPDESIIIGVQDRDSVAVKAEVTSHADAMAAEVFSGGGWSLTPRSAQTAPIFATTNRSRAVL